MNARNLIAAADGAIARIERANKALAVLEEIKRRHAPVDLGLITPVCTICCRDEADGALSIDCVSSHDHQPGRPACSTAEIIAEAGL